MFERQKSPKNVAILQQIPQIKLFQMIINVWCKSGVKLEIAEKAGFSRPDTNPLNRPGFVYRYNAYKHKASMVKWYHTFLVRTNYLVSTGWRHHA